MIEGRVIDVLDDVSGAILREIAEEPAPEFTKTSGFSPSLIEKLPDDKFALILITKEAQKLRKFPVHDPGNTWLSARYFKKTGGGLPEVASLTAARNIAKASRAYRIECDPGITRLGELTGDTGNVVDLNRIDEPDISRETAAKFAAEAERALAGLTAEDRRNLIEKAGKEPAAGGHEDFTEDGMFGLVRTAGERRYPLRNPLEVKTAAEYFRDHFEHLEPLQRVEFARNIHKRAGEEGIEDLPECVKLYAGDEYNPWLHGELIKRSEHLDDNGKNLLTELETRRGDLSPLQFGCALLNIEKTAGVDYANLSDPFAAVLKPKTKQKKKTVRIEFEGEHFEPGDLSAPGVKEKLEKYLKKKLTKGLLSNTAGTFRALTPQLQRLVFGIVKGRM